MVPLSLIGWRCDRAERFVLPMRRHQQRLGRLRTNPHVAFYNCASLLLDFMTALLSAAEIYMVAVI